MKKLILAALVLITVAFATQTTALAAPKRYSDNYVIGIAKDCTCGDPENCQCAPCPCGKENCEHVGQYKVIDENGDEVRSNKPDNVDQAIQHKEDFLAGELGIDYKVTAPEFRLTGGLLVLIMLALVGIFAIIGASCKSLISAVKGIRRHAKKKSSRRKVSTAPKGAGKPASKKRTHTA